MLWILPYFGYAFAASALASAAGYAAVTRFSVVQRVLAVALDRALKRISKNIDGSFEKYTVEHTETGTVACFLLRLEHTHLDSRQSILSVVSLLLSPFPNSDYRF